MAGVVATIAPRFRGAIDNTIAADRCQVSLRTTKETLTTETLKCSNNTRVEDAFFPR